MPAANDNIINLQEIKRLAEIVYEQFIIYSRVKQSTLLDDKAKKEQKVQANNALNNFRAALAKQIIAQPALSIEVDTAIISFYNILKKSAKTIIKEKKFNQVLSFSEAFDEELSVRGDLVEKYLPEDYANFLKKKVEKAYSYYCRYSQDNCKFSFFHHHGEDGRVNAYSFLKEIQKLSDTTQIKAAINEHLHDRKNGKRHPHSFKTILLAACSPEINFTKAHRLFPDYDTLQTTLKQFSKTFEIRCKKLFSDTKKTATNWDEFITFTPTSP